MPQEIRVIRNDDEAYFEREVNRFLMTGVWKLLDCKCQMSFFKHGQDTEGGYAVVHSVAILFKES